MATFIAIDSNYATDIAAASAYREQNIYPYLQGKGYSLEQFFGPSARRGLVAGSDQDPEVKLLTGVGHGTSTSFMGYNFEDIYAVGSYGKGEVAGKIAHFLSCNTASQLGPDFVSNGCLAFIGYDDNFMFDPNSADVFFECDGEIDRALADGLNVGDAMARAKALFTQRIGELGNTYAGSMLATNLACLRSPVDGSQWGRVDVALG